jgi:2,4-dienoyl-CoA reductase-like NADH-dependent reductase (Old Yellow Enzyme family)
MPHPDTSSLFRPFSVKSLELKNRIVMAPMTRLFSPEGIPGPASAAYYRRRAEGHVGLGRRLISPQPQPY